MKKTCLEKPEYFINREWSWLEFNDRVLYQAAHDRYPPLERLKFMSIVSSNLEEFFMVRVAVLKKVLLSGTMPKQVADATPTDIQLKEIRKRTKKMIREQYEILYDEILPLLKKKGIEIIDTPKKMETYKRKIKSVFEEKIKPVITPISISPTHPFPNLLTGRLYIAVEIESTGGLNKKIETGNISFIEVPVKIYGRFVAVDDNKYVPLENVIRGYVEQIYTGYKIISAGIIKITRDADFVIEEDEVSDLLKEIESKIKKMHNRSVVKLEYEKGLSPAILKTIVNKNNLSNDDIYPIKGMLNLDDLMEIYSGSRMVSLKDPAFPPVRVKDFEEKDIFEMIREGDFLLYQPYHSFDPVLELIERSADDKDVLAIKQILYRTSPESPVINALIRAAEKGKHVSVIVELKARFEEQRNINWAKRLENSGAHVIYGISGLKTHVKALLVVRKEKKGIRRYVHLSTGNYNELTARLYTDFSFFTIDDRLAEDISSLFNLLTGFSHPPDWNYISIAPLDLREKFISLIERETKNALRGMSARIIAKMNSLADKNVVKALYEASCAGVEIDLIVRGICIARPGIKKISGNITVTSIIGKYLEHARVFYFLNAGREEYFLSSADWMTRNLDERVELLFPVRDEKNRKIIRRILELQLDDSINGWLLQKDGSYAVIEDKNNKDSFKDIYDYINKKEAKIDDKNILLKPKYEK